MNVLKRLFRRGSTDPPQAKKRPADDADDVSYTKRVKAHLYDALDRAQSLRDENEAWREAWRAIETRRTAEQPQLRQKGTTDGTENVHGFYPEFSVPVSSATCDNDAGFEIGGTTGRAGPEDAGHEDASEDTAGFGGDFGSRLGSTELSDGDAGAYLEVIADVGASDRSDSGESDYSGANDNADLETVGASAARRGSASVHFADTDTEPNRSASPVGLLELGSEELMENDVFYDTFLARGRMQTPPTTTGFGGEDDGRQSPVAAADPGCAGSPSSSSFFDRELDEARPLWSLWTKRIDTESQSRELPHNDLIPESEEGDSERELCRVEICQDEHPEAAKPAGFYDESPSDAASTESDEFAEADSEVGSETELSGDSDSHHDTQRVPESEHDKSVQYEESVLGNVHGSQDVYADSEDSGSDGEDAVRASTGSSARTAFTPDFSIIDLSANYSESENSSDDSDEDSSESSEVGDELKRVWPNPYKPSVSGSTAAGAAETASCENAADLGAGDSNDQLKDKDPLQLDGEPQGDSVEESRFEAHHRSIYHEDMMSGPESELGSDSEEDLQITEVVDLSSSPEHICRRSESPERLDAIKSIRQTLCPKERELPVVSDSSSEEEGHPNTEEESSPRARASVTFDLDDSSDDSVSLSDYSLHTAESSGTDRTGYADERDFSNSGDSDDAPEEHAATEPQPAIWQSCWAKEKAKKEPETRRHYRFTQNVFGSSGPLYFYVKGEHEDSDGHHHRSSRHDRKLSKRSHGKHHGKHRHSSHGPHGSGKHHRRHSHSEWPTASHQTHRHKRKHLRWHDEE